MRTTVSQHFKNPRIKWNPWFFFQETLTNKFTLKITNDTILKSIINYVTIVELVGLVNCFFDKN